ncbi:MAG: AtpZ/AtpI family protein [Spirosomaceae bacterium]|nr:AtpZ/AtpI family protein [Spirosomataceae bacterium]
MEKPPSPNQYAKYAGMGFQMLTTIGLGTYLGVKLDEWQQNKIPGWTLVLSLLSIAISMYNFIRQLPKA